MRISDWSSDVCSSDLARGAYMVGETPCKDPLRHKNRRPGLVASTQPRLEILIAEAADFLQFVAVAVPQPDRRQWDAVEAIGLDHRIMRLVEEGETDRKSTRLNSSH